MNSTIARRQGILARAVIVILAFVIVAITTSRSPVRASVRDEIPADGEMWVKIDSISRDSRKCKPGNMPAVYCNPADTQVLTPEVIRQMVGTQ